MFPSAPRCCRNVTLFFPNELRYASNLSNNCWGISVSASIRPGRAPGRLRSSGTPGNSETPATVRFLSFSAMLFCETGSGGDRIGFIRKPHEDDAGRGAGKLRNGFHRHFDNLAFYGRQYDLFTRIRDEL